jgi:hypothetical protein
MSDRRAGSGQRPEIIGLSPMRPGVIIKENAVADDRAWRKHAGRIQPFDRGLAAQANDFVKPRQRLRGVDLLGQIAFARLFERVAKKSLGAGVDLLGGRSCPSDLRPIVEHS